MWDGTGECIGCSRSLFFTMECDAIGEGVKGTRAGKGGNFTNAHGVDHRYNCRGQDVPVFRTGARKRQKGELVWVADGSVWR